MRDVQIHKHRRNCVLCGNLSLTDVRFTVPELYPHPWRDDTDFGAHDSIRMIELGTWELENAYLIRGLLQ